VAIAPGAVADVDRAALRDEPRGLDRERRGSDPTVAPYVGWRSAQPDMVRVVSRVPRKLDRARITALGNAVVPQCAEAIGYLIQALVDAGDRRVGDSIQGL
jgi:hypothetical protein